MSASQTSQKWREVLSLWARMRYAGVEPNVVTYSALVSVFEKCQDWKGAVAVLAALCLAGLLPNEVTHGRDSLPGAPSSASARRPLNGSGC
mmetsp:Transcript_21755/g.50772  ORF Transcript_21755/g.50772 Transcript_21755/m.50772 type:complete len:91 (+) Transcript_21755:160-432(+)